MTTLADRISRLRRTRATLHVALAAAYRDPDPGFRAQKAQAATLALKSTDQEWDRLLAEKQARSDHVELAMLKHQLGRLR